MTVRKSKTSLPIYAYFTSREDSISFEAGLLSCWPGGFGASHWLTFISRQRDNNLPLSEALNSVQQATGITSKAKIGLNELGDSLKV